MPYLREFSAKLLSLSLTARKAHGDTAAAAKHKHLLVILNCRNDFFQRL
jgi:hypothetical protein